VVQIGKNFLEMAWPLFWRIKRPPLNAINQHAQIFNGNTENIFEESPTWKNGAKFTDKFALTAIYKSIYEIIYIFADTFIVKGNPLRAEMWIQNIPPCRMNGGIRLFRHQIGKTFRTIGLITFGAGKGFPVLTNPANIFIAGNHAIATAHIASGYRAVFQHIIENIIDVFSKIRIFIIKIIEKITPIFCDHLLSGGL